LAVCAAGRQRGTANAIKDIAAAAPQNGGTAHANQPGGIVLEK